ncbi:MAG: hypothetical protein M3N51_05800 [Actinomycetota bacterium]|nr:hypothetical protein [Actinomycetota bacterium]
MLLEFHTWWAYAAVTLCGLAGLWGVVLRLLKRPAGQAFRVGAAVGIGAILLQVAVGLALYGQGRRGGTFHLFYGVVILVTLAFAYIYRDQLSKRAPLAWGLLLLFLMGLGIRAMTTVERGLG